jgi:quinol monooxygenase YgiN
MASTELQAIVRFRFHDGDVVEFKRLSAQCMEIVRTQDTGTLQYDTYFNDDETECIVIERFRDSDALIQHGENLAHLMDAIVATGSVSGELLGEPSTELRARFTGARCSSSRPGRRCRERVYQAWAARSRVASGSSVAMSSSSSPGSRLS